MFPFKLDSMSAPAPHHTCSLKIKWFEHWFNFFFCIKKCIRIRTTQSNTVMILACDSVLLLWHCWGPGTGKGSVTRRNNGPISGLQACFIYEWANQAHSYSSDDWNVLTIVHIHPLPLSLDYIISWQFAFLYIYSKKGIKPFWLAVYSYCRLPLLLRTSHYIWDINIGPCQK